LDEIIDFYLENIKEGRNKQSNKSMIEGYRALSYVLFENGSRCSPNKVSQLIECILPAASPTNSDKEGQRLAINCLGNLCTKAGNNITQNVYSRIYDLLFCCYELYSQEVKRNPSYCKVLMIIPMVKSQFFKLLSSTLRSMQYVITEAKNLKEQNMKEFLDDLKASQL
jgi:hypothetical protein